MVAIEGSESDLQVSMVSEVSCVERCGGREKICQGSCSKFRFQLGTSPTSGFGKSSRLSDSTGCCSSLQPLLRSGNKWRNDTRTTRHSKGAVLLKEQHVQH